LKKYLLTLPNKINGIIYEVEISAISLKLNIKVILHQNSKTKIINFSISGFKNEIIDSTNPETNPYNTNLKHNISLEIPKYTIDHDQFNKFLSNNLVKIFNNIPNDFNINNMEIWQIDIKNNTAEFLVYLRGISTKEFRVNLKINLNNNTEMTINKYLENFSLIQKNDFNNKNTFFRNLTKNDLVLPNIENENYRFRTNFKFKPNISNKQITGEVIMKIEDIIYGSGTKTFNVILGEKNHFKEFNTQRWLESKGNKNTKKFIDVNDLNESKELTLLFNSETNFNPLTDFIKNKSYDLLQVTAPWTKNDTGWFDLNKRDAQFGPDKNFCAVDAALNLLYWWINENKTQIDEYLKNPENGLSIDKTRDIRSVVYNTNQNVLLDWLIEDMPGGTSSTFKIANWFFKGEPYNGTHGKLKLEKGGFFRNLISSENVNLNFVNEYDNFENNNTISWYSGTNYITDILMNSLPGTIAFKTTVVYGALHEVNFWGPDYDENGNLYSVYVTDSNDGAETFLLSKRGLLRKFLIPSESNPENNVILGDTYFDDSQKTEVIDIQGISSQNYLFNSKNKK